MPFVFQRKLYLLKQRIQDWWKLRHCRKHGHTPGVIWFFAGIPYPPSKNYNGKHECSFVGGGALELRGWCTHCWKNYDMLWPVKNPDYELEGFIHEFYPQAVFIDLRKLLPYRVEETTPMRDVVRLECERLDRQEESTHEKPA